MIFKSAEKNIQICCYFLKHGHQCHHERLYAKVPRTIFQDMGAEQVNEYQHATSRQDYFIS